MAPLLKVHNLVKNYPATRYRFSKSAETRALQGVSFSVEKGETLALVGESGCGKSTLGRCLVRLIEPTSGTVTFDSISLTDLTPRQLKPLRRRMQIIFQDPYGSLNPRRTVNQTLAEPLLIHKLGEGRKGRQKRIDELLDQVGLPRSVLTRYPHEFSGGQRQRIGIARALAVSPEFIICDEPVSALDVSIQAQIINLLMDLQKALNLTYLFISHDLRVVRHISHRVAVLYLGKIVEIGTGEQIYENPRHPYTRALLSSVPRLMGDPVRARITLSGEPPKPTDPPPGCQFHPRCAIAIPKCATEIPSPVSDLVPGKHQASCFLV